MLQTLTATSTASQPPLAKPKSQGRPQDSMKSTWHTKAMKDTWGFPHYVLDWLNILPSEDDQPVPVHDKNDPVPYFTNPSGVVWVMAHALVPLALHEAWLRLTGYQLGTFAAFNLYFTAFNVIVLREAQIIRRLGSTFGFLDGDQHERDGVPDVGVGKVVSALYKTTGSRMLLAAYATYDPKVSPLDAMSSPAWWGWLFVQTGAYAAILDFWFYWYHRAMHDVSFLWKFHRTHHLTKHPNSLMSAYADHEQEFFDMVGVPFMTWATMRGLGIPLGFYEWFICHQFIAFTEVFGHSGLRVYGQPPSPWSWLLDWFGMGLVVEDHDMHHRHGYRKTHNYGKQTRIWDVIFGTAGERVELHEDNLDHNSKFDFPLY